MTDRRKATDHRKVPVVSSVSSTPAVAISRRPLVIGAEPVVLRNSKRATVVHGAPPVVTKPLTRRVAKPSSRRVG
jgi:hypothetical protein